MAEIKVTFDDAAVDALATAIAAKLGAPAVAAAEKAKPAEKPAAAAKPEKAKPAAEKVEKPAVKRADVLEAVKNLGNKVSRDAAKGLIAKYAPSFGEVSDDDLAALLADVNAAIEAADAPADDDAGEY